MLALIRRAGAGWIAATYDHDGKNSELFAGEWESVRGEVRRALDSSPTNHTPTATAGNGDAIVLASVVWWRPGGAHELLDASEPKHRTRIRNKTGRRRLRQHLIDRPAGQIEPTR